MEPETAAHLNHRAKPVADRRNAAESLLAELDHECRASEVHLRACYGLKSFGPASNNNKSFDAGEF
jgi:hypothetical protein